MLRKRALHPDIDRECIGSVKAKQCRTGRDFDPYALDLHQFLQKFFITERGGCCGELRAGIRGRPGFPGIVWHGRVFLNAFRPGHAVRVSAPCGCVYASSARRGSNRSCPRGRCPYVGHAIAKSAKRDTLLLITASSLLRGNLSAAYPENCFR